MVAIAPAAAYLLGVAVIVGAVVAGNGGVFAYTLDDPYVHLELARGLAHGHHGVNPGEFSAPSSSPLWPWLLVPTWWTGGAVLAPLALNVVAGLLGVVALVEAARRVLGPVAAERPGWAAGLAVALVAIANLVALTPTGMEHTLQVALTAWLAVGLFTVDADGRLPRWWPVVALVLPLLRLEDTGLVLLACAWLAVRGHRRAALGVVLGVAGSIGAYLAWLHARSGWWLPFSILSKRDMFPVAILQVADPAVIVPLLLAGWLLWRSRRDAHPGLPLVAAGALIGHDLLAQVGLFHRYVAYVGTFLVLVAAWREREGIRAALRAGGSSARVVAWVAAILAVVHAKVTVDAVGAGHHVWRLHGQMRRIAVEVLDGPVAVNDIGWVSYDNDRDVVDLVGLASADALRHRLAHDPPDWMADLARAHGVEAVLIYPHWFPDGLPDAWVHVATLVVTRSSFADDDRRLWILAPDRAAAGPLRDALAAFAPSLPDGVALRPER